MNENDSGELPEEQLDPRIQVSQKILIRRHLEQFN